MEKENDQMSWKEKINLDRLPEHLAIIMDGNGRWAKKHGKFRLYGHEHGVRPVRDCSEACAELGVKYLTLYAFSTENWNRPKAEVDALMSLLVKTINKEVPTLNKNNIRLTAIGDLKSLPKDTREKLEEAIQSTSQNTRLNLVLALSYSSQWEITEAVKGIVDDVVNHRLKPEDIDVNCISDHLATQGIPNPELLIRTSGELRLSNFLLWQLAYSELYFTDKLWPDFSTEDLYEAIVNFQSRERRFGKTSEQS